MTIFSYTGETNPIYTHDENIVTLSVLFHTRQLLSLDDVGSLKRVTRVLTLPCASSTSLSKLRPNPLFKVVKRSRTMAADHHDRSHEMSRPCSDP